MSYYRKRAYPADGLVDDPDDLWTEFQRLRGAITGTDQNNWRQNGIERKRIVKPIGTHNGPSDIANQGGTLCVDSFSGGLPNTLAATDGLWQNTQGMAITARARMEGPWVVAACAQFTLGAAINDRAMANIRIAASAARVDGLGTAVMGANAKDGTALVFTTILLPAGDSILQLQHRVVWTAPYTGTVDLNKAFMWAFALYK